MIRAVGPAIAALLAFATVGGIAVATVVVHPAAPWAHAMQIKEKH
jgi:hypothetical protein